MMRQRNFKETVGQTRGLERAWCSGLGALRPEDKPHIVAENTRNIRGSVDIDAAYQAADPHGNRWDFAIAYKHTNRDGEVIYWVELHTASDSQITKVIKKARWLLDWFKSTGAELAKFEKDIVWVSSGSTHLSPTSPQKKMMAMVGLRQTGTKLTIKNQR